MKKVLFTATVDSHILHFHIPYLKYFKEKGYEVHVATNGTAEIPFCDVKHVVSFERSPLKIKNLKAIRQLKKIIDTEKFDIIHTHTPMGSVVTRIAAMKSRKKNKTRVIYTAHGFHFYKGSSKKNWLIFYPIEKLLSRVTDTLITINNEDYELAKKKFKCNVEYVHGVGVDPDKFNFNMPDEEKATLRKSLGLKKSDFVMIYPAELNENKNQKMLIEVMKVLVEKDKSYHILFAGKDSIDGYYQKMVSNYGLGKNIHFLGYRNDIQKLLQISNMSLSASLREGLPVNIMEAQMAGIPSVVTNCRGNRDLVINGQNGYVVEINDVKDMVEKIEWLRNNKINPKLDERYYLKNALNKTKEIYNMDNKKKIFHVLASNSYSGAENVACTIISNMSEEYDMYYCCPEGPIEEALKERKINYILIKRLSYNELKKVIRKYKPDIIHAHDNKATVLSSLFSKNIKIISHIHGNNKIMNSSNIKTLLFNLISKKINRFIWVSDSSLNEYYFSDKIRDKSLVLYNVIDSKKIAEKANKTKCKEMYDLIYLGRLEYPKNPQRLIEIMRLLKEKNSKIKIAIVGDGKERKNIEELIIKYDLQKNIKMYGFQKNPYPILKSSKVLIMTSIYEGTPMCALEAISLGKPIISTPVDGLVDIVKSDLNGYLVNNNDEFVDKIIYLTCNNEKLQKMKDQINQISLETNNIKEYINKIEKIYFE